MNRIKGAIYAAEVVENAWREFGSAREYVCAYLIQSGAPPKPLLFTPHDLREAAERARKNPEDCPKFAGETLPTVVEIGPEPEPAWLLPIVAVIAMASGAAVTAAVLL